MLRRKPKRYSVERNAEGYEIRDAEAAGAQLFFSASRKAVRGIAHELNRKPRTDENLADLWKGGYSGSGGVVG